MWSRLRMTRLPMGKRARLPELDDEPQSPLAEAVAAVGGALARNPVLVGGTTAFLVALSYVSANAIWYQPHFHNGAFFATRANNYVGPRTQPCRKPRSGSSGRAKPKPRSRRPIRSSDRKSVV